MGFRFPLEALLRLRVTLTRQEEMRLEAISQKLGAARHQRELLLKRKREYEVKFAADMTAGLPAGEVQFRYTGRRGLAEAEKQIDQTILALERAWQEQQQKFIEARQRQEVMETVRDGQLATYQEDQRRRDQQMVDDLFLAGMNREKAEKQRN
jgi:flagellar export protein FliJ